MARRVFVSVAIVIVFAAACLGGLGFIALNMGLHGPWSNEFALNADFVDSNYPRVTVRARDAGTVAR